MSKQIVKIILVSFTLLAAGLACALPTLQQNQPTAVSQNEIETRAVETLHVLLTEAAGQSSGSPTNSAVNATPTVQAATVNPPATAEPVATATSRPPEPTATPTTAPVPCDSAGFVADISVSDGTTLPAGSQFTKTWRLKNSGTCTWTADYAIVFDSGESMSGPASQKIGTSVPPGQTVDISVPLKAPGQVGQYRGNWKLRNASGVLFGSGSSNLAFYVEIKVVPASAAGSGYDFTANFCLAEWTSVSKTLSCAGQDGSADGFVLYKARPLLENGNTDDEPALLTNPAKVNDAVIRGKYPAYAVQSGDHFKSVIGCEYNAKSCNVKFQLDYQVDNGSIETLGSWTETLDGNFTSIDVDLSNLAGKNVRFILTVLSNGASENDRAQWLLPRIEKVNMSGTKP